MLSVGSDGQKVRCPVMRLAGVGGGRRKYGAGEGQAVVHVGCGSPHPLWVSWVRQHWSFRGACMLACAHTHTHTHKQTNKKHTQSHSHVRL